MKSEFVSRRRRRCEMAKLGGCCGVIRPGDVAIRTRPHHYIHVADLTYAIAALPLIAETINTFVAKFNQALSDMVPVIRRTVDSMVTAGPVRPVLVPSLDASRVRALADSEIAAWREILDGACSQWSMPIRGACSQLC